MSLAAALLLAGAGMPQSASLETAALAAFDRHCKALDGMGAMAGRIAAAGWAEFTPAADSELGKLLGFTAEAGKEIPDFSYSNRVFAPKGDQSLVAIVTSAGIPSLTSLECRIVAIDATKAPTAAQVTAWAKKPADESFDEDGLTAWRWNTGPETDRRETSVAFVPKDSPLREQMPLLGLTVQTSREFRK